MPNELDPTLVSRMLARLQAENRKLLGSGRVLADLVGIRRAHLEQILLGKKSVNARSVQKIADYFSRIDAEAAAAAKVVASALVMPPELMGSGGSTIRLVELDAVAQRQYIAARLEAAGIPKGLASEVALQMEFDHTGTLGQHALSALELAKSMLARDTEN